MLCLNMKWFRKCSFQSCLPFFLQAARCFEEEYMHFILISISYCQIHSKQQQNSIFCYHILILQISTPYCSISINIQDLQIFDVWINKTLHALFRVEFSTKILIIIFSFFLYFFFDTGSNYMALAWTSLCRVGWPWIDREPLVSSS